MGNGFLGGAPMGIGGLILLALDIWAIISVVNSGASTGGKVLWVLLILFLPLLGFILWLLFGPRGRV
ncbi:PLDc N-terminal domain-containing protein [Rhodovulum sp. DZ06]|uniref:PLDc N-terminal domain-containing protein n=1 Tax=Rhodovulum sp. DZ06 TaxID=3425126 RepID=UPI003D3564D7